MKLDLPLGDPHEDACAYSKYAELEVLTDTKHNLQLKAKEVDEETTGVVTAVDEGENPCVNLQRLGVSQQDTTLKGIDTPIIPSILLRIKSPPRLLVTETEMWATRKLRPGANTKTLPLDLPSPKGSTKTPSSNLPEQIQAITYVEKLLGSLQGKKSQCVTRQDSQVLAHILEGKMTLGIAHECPFDPANPHMQGSTILEQNPISLKALVHVHQM